MNIYTERGIVLHSLKYSENQLIVHILTQQHGRRSYITRIAGKNSGRSLYQPLYLLEFQAIVGKGELHKISQVAAAQPLSDIPHHIVKSTIALFISEVLYRIIKEDAVDNRLFDFVYSSVVALDLTQGSVANFHLYFIVRLAHYMGFTPQGRWSAGAWFDIKSGTYEPLEPQHMLRLRPQQASLLWSLSEINIEHLSELELCRADRTDFLDAIIDFYGYHTESIYLVNSVAMFREIF